MTPLRSHVEEATTPEELIGRVIGTRLRQLASSAGLSQDEIAEQAGRSRGTVSMLMNGNIKDPPIGTVMAVAGVFGASLDQVVGLKPLPTIRVAHPESAEDLRRLLPRVLQRLARVERQVAERQPPLQPPRQDRREDEASATSPRQLPGAHHRAKKK